MALSNKILFIIPLQVITILAYFPIARKLKLFDVPNERSSHTSLTFRGGGVIVPISLFFYSIFFGFQNSYLILGVLLASAISFYDDIKGSNPFLRLMCHFIAVGLVMMDITDGIQFLPFVTILIAIIAVAAVNAYNFMDGINGITGLYTLSIYETVYFYDYRIENVFDENLIAILTIALLIFGFYNFRSRAVLFAGDVGSVSLGLIAVFYVLFLILHNNDIIYLSMVAVYGVESGLTIFYRLIKGQNIFQPHRMHLFQDLVNIAKMPHLVVSFIYTIIQVVINFGMFLCIKEGFSGYLYFIYVIILLLCTYIIVKYQIHKRLVVPDEEN
ncbi:MAG: UDP-GlcNAc--UDP-phosphate GlcNAc-1-phosphate transferase [Bacteroidia bacterium]